jgi:UrcA family protein
MPTNVLVRAYESVTEFGAFTIQVSRKESIMKMLTIATTLLFSVSLGSALSVSASAETGDIPSVMVKFADLDISSPDGATRLYSRIQRAANSVCSPFDRRGVTAQANFRACVSDAIGRAVAKVGSSSLNAVYSAKTGATVRTRLATSGTH